MTPHRRKAVSLAALAPTTPIALGYGWEWGYLLPLVGAVGGVVMLAAVWVIVYAVLPGVDAAKGTPVVFVAAWGAVVLAAALGAAGAAVVGNELMRGGVPHSSYESAGGAAQETIAVVEGTDRSFGPTPLLLWSSVLPDGTAGGALLTGWLAGGAAAIAYSRTRPRAAVAGAEGRPSGEPGDGGEPGSAAGTDSTDGPDGLGGSPGPAGA